MSNKLGGALCATLAAVLSATAVVTFTTGGSIMPGATDDGGVGLFGNPLTATIHLAFAVLALAGLLRRGLRRLLAQLGSLAFLGLTAFDVVALLSPVGEDEPLGVRWPLLVVDLVALALWLATVRSSRPATPASSTQRRGQSEA
ncbi:hypothetical protein V5P93_003818 [Actinokineospora auranticolor]|uniref:DUF4383 domain-containing protein n=1 Tax=Actinokineospora auranticolor TaxID=155976 RepID=A0A2S6GLK8_9PSEU|nr:hypothetical protein [Actinokineospora auranticolor]PPK66105.1 hypothetical protein CLV40_11169 [Actinokineospora auranticolor]